MDVLTQLKEANKIRTKESFGHTVNDWSLPQWGNAVAGETGELCNIIKKIARGDFNDNDYRIQEANMNEVNDKLADEAADIVCYLDLLCQKTGINLRDAIIDKFNAVSIKVGSDIKLYDE